MPHTAFDHYVTHALAPTARVTTVVPEEQNSDYEAGLAVIDGERWHIRTARITPTKPGAFVALWRRDADGDTVPLPHDDDAQGALIFVMEGERRGVFRFTAEHLHGLGVTSSERRPGKRGFRVYPAWCDDLNARATASQTAQASAFTELV
ncbi:MepB family protein [Leucobacter japonicus]|uniref:MepB family protein n=1 Tax=Leucobacter japonicus TaxID=1461259 RepID=UPI0006A7919E|nr:MepB family protein [Leucobacter japonicus]